MRIFQVCRLFAAVLLFGIASICYECTYIFCETRTNEEIDNTGNINQQSLYILMPENNDADNNIGSLARHKTMIDKSMLQRTKKSAFKLAWVFGFVTVMVLLNRCLRSLKSGPESGHKRRLADKDCLSDAGKKTGKLLLGLTLGALGTGITFIGGTAHALEATKKALTLFGLTLGILYTTGITFISTRASRAALYLLLDLFFKAALLGGFLYLGSLFFGFEATAAFGSIIGLLYFAFFRSDTLLGQLAIYFLAILGGTTLAILGLLLIGFLPEPMKDFLRTRM